MKNLPDFDQAPTLYRLGISYHAYGDIKDGRKIVARWFKADKVTKEQKEALQALDDSVYFLSASPEYAPELKSVLICFKTKAQLKREKHNEEIVC
jgi:hypothetical protein